MQYVRDETISVSVTVTMVTRVMASLANRSARRMKYMERAHVRNLVITLLVACDAIAEVIAIVQVDFIFKEEIVYLKNSVAVLGMDEFYR